MRQEEPSGEDGGGERQTEGSTSVVSFWASQTLSLKFPLLCMLEITRFVPFAMKISRGPLAWQNQAMTQNGRIFPAPHPFVQEIMFIKTSAIRFGEALIATMRLISLSF